ncbi:MBL fold metallo-hydrolase [Natrinema caseinilyticum]|uniref:MBL fold metallo-hydrolase n=1 Tax=Natrinema caseinilyticum TaxID=2961570 RepID=UPI0020C4F110|nr:MBL fold metallo-hydrolase [Natrinema caseinilyticum]
MNDTDDWFDIEEISDNSWRISEATFFNDYLFAGEERALLLDASVGIGNLRAMVETLVDVPVTVVLTHSHWDHMGAAHQFDDVRVHNAELPSDGTVRSDYVAEEFHVDLSGWIDSWRDQGGQFPDGFDPENYEIQPASNITDVAEGEVVDIGNRELEFIHLPGHAPGQLGALDRERGDLYGGDVIHIQQNLYIHFGGCDIHDYVDTFARLRELRDEGVFDTLYTAHNPPMSGDELSLLDEYHEGLQAILADELPYRSNDERPPGRVYRIAGNEVITKPDVS